MTNKHSNKRNERNSDFIVVKCPDSEGLYMPLFGVRSRFHKNEMAMMILHGGIPSGAIIRLVDTLFLVYEKALYLLDDDWDVTSDEPAMTPKYIKCNARWIKRV